MTRADVGAGTVCMHAAMGMLLEDIHAAIVGGSDGAAAVVAVVAVATTGGHCGRQRWWGVERRQDVIATVVHIAREI